MKWPEKPIYRVIMLSASYTYRNEAPWAYVPYNGLPLPEQGKNKRVQQPSQTITRIDKHQQTKNGPFEHEKDDEGQPLYDLPTMNKPYHIRPLALSNRHRRSNKTRNDWQNGRELFRFRSS
jgi:hypothetical protein